jgi:hypothetical protein
VKYYLTSLVLGLALPLWGHGSAREVALIPLVATQKYDPNLEAGREFSQFTSSFGLATFGNLFRSAAIDVEGDIRTKLDMPELKSYFPSAKENAAIAKAIASRVNRDYLNGGLTNARVIGAISYATSDLVGRIILRAMEREGIKDGERRQIWAQRILGPFRVCVKKTKTYGEAERCLANLQTDLVKNIGLAIGYEMVRQEMGATFGQKVPAVYRRCLGASAQDSRVKPCIVSSMRSAAENFGVDQVSAVAQRQVPAAAKAVAARVRPGFARCLGGAKDRAGFGNCADALVASAGAEIAAEAVKANPQVLTYFPNSESRARLAASAKLEFTECMAEVKKNNQRDEKGTLATEPCALRVKLGVASTVAKALFAANLKNVQGLEPAQKSEIERAATRQLDGCWNPRGSMAENNACMGSAIESLVTAVAEAKLARELPATLRAQRPSLMNNLLNGLRACMKTELPANIFEATNAAEKVEQCAAGLLREAARSVAAHQLEVVLHGKSADAGAPARLVGQLVTKDFSACLGPLPNEKIVTGCSADLKRSAGIEVAKLLFREEFDKFISINGGLASLGLTKDAQDAYLAGLLSRHESCLNEKIKREKPLDVDAAVDSCFKGSIEGLASYLADVVFGQRLKENLPGGKAPEIYRRFAKDFTGCLREKNDPQFTVNQYVAHINACKKRLQTPYTLEIAIEATRAQGRQVMNGGELPQALAKLEDKLKICLEEREPEVCAKEHAQNAAKLLGSIKLRRTLGDALGAKEFASSRREIDDLEKKFFACVDRLPVQKAQDDFLRELTACGREIEEQGIGFVQRKLASWMEQPNLSPEQKKISMAVAQVLPCFDTVMPASPIDADAIVALDPEGMLRPIAQAIADYINYEGENAKADLSKVISQLESDLAAAGPPEARRRLVDLLLQSGMLDRFLKSMALAAVRTSLRELPKEEQLPAALTKVLLDRATIEQALTPAIMDQLRPVMSEKILKPLLLEGRSLLDPAQKLAAEQLVQKVASALLDSPEFGEKLVSGAVQQQIDAETKGSVSRWFMRGFGYSFNWDILRKTESGRAAEKYVKEQIIQPRVLGQSLSPAEMAKRKKEAARLVQEAVKKQ